MPVGERSPHSYDDIKPAWLFWAPGSVISLPLFVVSLGYLFLIAAPGKHLEAVRWPTFSICALGLYYGVVTIGGILKLWAENNRLRRRLYGGCWFVNWIVAIFIVLVLDVWIMVLIARFEAH